MTRFLLPSKRLKNRVRSLAIALLAASGLSLASIASDTVPLDAFDLPEDLEVSLWASSPLFYNPTNMDVDHRGRVWVAEGVNYRKFRNKTSLTHPTGDRIMILEDTDGDGKADESKVFWQDTSLVAPLGIAVIDNKILISQPPSLIAITDVNRNDRFDDEDTKEILLTGFDGLDHDHSLHSVTVGPNGQYYFNTGNAGNADVESPDLHLYTGTWYLNGTDKAKKSSDGHQYVGGVAMRMNPDGTGLSVIGHNFRNSYEQTVTSYGDVFNNDNDDPPAARTTWLMEYGNLGFSSFDGLRAWRSEKRPDQSTAEAEWRQDDPGTLPAGDVYGGGAPTGIVFYEGDALGEEYNGMLLTCEPTRNVVFGYKPQPYKAGFKLDRFDFFGSNSTNIFYGADFSQSGIAKKEERFQFRPSDVAIGPDGALYVSDWFDTRVGGHTARDENASGSIYRIAPKDKKLKTPKIDYTSTKGLVEAFKSPAVNVRGAAFYALREKEAASVSAVSKLLKDENQYVQARAVFLLAQLGPKGIALAEERLKDSDPQMRIAAFRALRAAGSSFMSHATALSKDSSAAVRREVAVSLRDAPFGEMQGAFLNIVDGYDGEDRWYLEAIGTSVALEEEKAYAFLKSRRGKSPVKWTEAFANIAWRLHPESAIDDMKAYAMDTSKSMESRVNMLTAIAYNESEKGGKAMVDIALNAEGAEVTTRARWFIENRSTSYWSEYGLLDAIGSVKATLTDSIVPAFPKAKKEVTVEEVMAYTPDLGRGKRALSQCYMCHTFGNQGIDFGPDLTAFAKGNPSDVLINAIIDPSADISHGFEGIEINTKDKKTIQGFLVSDGNTVVIRIFGGADVAIDADNIASRKDLRYSFMPSAASLDISAENVAHMVAYLKSL
ncbi:MAG: hypothetical protein CBD18_07420 [Opitutales bacterium TMED158]|nr:MAG: hypothetical protein CBD18_07420 [Opitutales bacterium TMED158]